MDEKNIILKKLNTLEEITFCFWEVEKGRLAFGTDSRKKFLYEETAHILRELESIFVRNKVRDLPGLLNEKDSAYLRLRQHLMNPGVVGDEYTPGLRHICESVEEMMRLIES